MSPNVNIFLLDDDLADNPPLTNAVAKFKLSTDPIKVCDIELQLHARTTKIKELTNIFLLNHWMILENRFTAYRLNKLVGGNFLPISTFTMTTNKI